MSASALTVLRRDNRHIAAKRFLADGTVLAYDAGARFAYQRVPITDITGLAAVTLERMSAPMKIVGRDVISEAVSAVLRAPRVQKGTGHDY